MGEPVVCHPSSRRLHLPAHARDHGPGGARPLETYPDLPVRWPTLCGLGDGTLIVYAPRFADYAGWCSRCVARANATGRTAGARWLIVQRGSRRAA